jgi:1-deoxy-D-xylulose-5-phosphate synthase
MNDYPLLNTLELPKGIKNLDIKQLSDLCAELRRFIPEATQDKWGHILSSLGVTELTVALHYLLDTPHDVLIWDVGHQAYVHKVLTGRLSGLAKNRKINGISGFPARSESLFDAFGTGHSSTSISALGGMAVGAQLLGQNKRFVAVIGDGALTGGMAFEALNHLSTLGLNLTIVLNDNQLAIDENVGALHVRQSYAAFFSSLGIGYTGPVRGDALVALIPALKGILEQPGLQVLHVRTQKPNLPTTSKPAPTAHIPLQEVFAETLKKLAKDDPRITAITPAMLSGCALDLFQKDRPERTFDTGITEQHAVTFAAGQAAAGLRPYVNIYSTFAQRAYDQIIHDVALQSLPVVFCIERAGLVGEDGPTHHGAFDLAFLRCVPKLIVSAPASAQELRDLMFTASRSNQPFCIRYPRTTVPTEEGASDQMTYMAPGEALMRKAGTGTVVLSTGFVSDLVDDLLHLMPDWGHIHFPYVKPLDLGLLKTVSTQYQAVITLEDGVVAGGFGSAVAETGLLQGLQLHHFGLPDAFVPHGTIQELKTLCGLNAEQIVRSVLSK